MLAHPLRTNQKTTPVGSAQLEESQDASVFDIEMDFGQRAVLPCCAFYQPLELRPCLLQNTLLKFLQHLAALLRAGHPSLSRR